MLHDVIPNYDFIEDRIQKIAPSGYIMAMNIRMLRPEYYHTTYPEIWRRRYSARGYVAVDPIIVWSMVNIGAKRWSDIYEKSHDPLGLCSHIRTQAAEHGLRYGIVISTRNPEQRRRRTIFSAAHPEREFTDDEIEELADCFDLIRSFTDRPCDLNPEEVEVLEAMAIGCTYREVAEKVGVNQHTVKKRVERARRELGARNAAHAVALAVARGIVMLSGDKEW